MRNLTKRRGLLILIISSIFHAFTVFVAVYTLFPIMIMTGVDGAFRRSPRIRYSLLFRVLHLEIGEPWRTVRVSAFPLPVPVPVSSSPTGR